MSDIRCSACNNLMSEEERFLFLKHKIDALEDRLNECFRVHLKQEHGFNEIKIEGETKLWKKHK